MEKNLDVLEKNWLQFWNQHANFKSIQFIFFKLILSVFNCILIVTRVHIWLMIIKQHWQMDVPYLLSPEAELFTDQLQQLWMAEWQKIHNFSDATKKLVPTKMSLGKNTRTRQCFKVLKKNHHINCDKYLCLK